MKTRISILTCAREQPTLPQLLSHIRAEYAGPLNVISGDAPRNGHAYARTLYYSLLASTNKRETHLIFEDDAALVAGWRERLSRALGIIWWQEMGWRWCLSLLAWNGIAWPFRARGPILPRNPQTFVCSVAVLYTHESARAAMAGMDETPKHPDWDIASREGMTARGVAIYADNIAQHVTSPSTLGHIVPPSMHLPPAYPPCVLAPYVGE